MSAFQWRNNGIKRLHAKGDPSRPATLLEFVVWKDGVDSSTCSVGGLYVMLMIKYFEKTPKTIPMFEDLGINVDYEGNADYASADFPAQFV
eukprot:2890673-Rhodomonas_salina.1